MESVDLVQLILGRNTLTQVLRANILGRSVLTIGVRWRAIRPRPSMDTLFGVHLQAEIVQLVDQFVRNPVVHLFYDYNCPH